jgi:hypothetical protein
VSLLRVHCGESESARVKCNCGRPSLECWGWPTTEMAGIPVTAYEEFWLHEVNSLQSTRYGRRRLRDWV